MKSQILYRWHQPSIRARVRVRVRIRIRISITTGGSYLVGICRQKLPIMFGVRVKGYRVDGQWLRVRGDTIAPQPRVRGEGLGGGGVRRLNPPG